MPAESIVRLEDVRKSYRMGPVTVEALRGVSLDIKAGEFISIMGPSGCGKSTLLNLLGCLDRPTTGRYLLGGVDVSAMADDELSTVRGARLGFIFQSYNLIQQLTVVENIELTLYHQGKSETESRPMAIELARRVGLEERLHHKPFELSGGQQQRVAIARALVNDPLVILADEPTGNLDSTSGAEILKIFDELHQQGKTLILVTHDENVARRATRAIRLRDGTIESDVALRDRAVTEAAPVAVEERKETVADEVQAFLQFLRGLSGERLKRAFRLGLKSLWLHRLRSALTMLGIVFGVCSVIAMLAIGEGASHEAQEQIKNLGSQNIILRSVKPPEEQKVSDQNSQNYVLKYGLTHTDISRIKSTIPGVTVVVPGRIVRDYVWNISRRVDCDIVGTVPWYPEMRNHYVAEGRFFSDREMEEKANVCVLGAEMVDKLFPLGAPMGRDVRVGGTYYRVIGVMQNRVVTSKDEDAVERPKDGAANRMFIPLATATARYGEILMKRRSGSFEAEEVELHEVTVKVATPEQVVGVAEAVKELMQRNHKKADYDIIVPLELLKRAERTKQIFNVVLGSIAAISLLVGGIGIMNIMLANVTERTREIGIRRALGSKRRDIITQFLVEAVILSGTGGLLGVALGIAIPFVVTWFADMVTIVTFWSPVIAFGISGWVGIVFGLYPAFRAASMDPVEALRHE
ncbi:MAG: ABC transporter permease [Verrucomicrobiota bacterium]